MCNQNPKEKIRVLHVIGTLHIGGAENVAMNCLRCIDKDRYSIDYLVYDNEKSPYTEEVTDLGGRVIRKNVLYNRIHVQKALREIMERYGPYDIVHSHLMFHNGYVMRAAKKCHIKKRISMAHSTSDGRSKRSIVGLLYRTYMRALIKKDSTKYLACGKKSGQYLYGKKFFEQRGEIVKNRIDVKNFEYSKKKQDLCRSCLGMGDEIVFLVVGHLIPLKNHFFALHIFKEIKKEIPKSKIYVLGDGEMKDELIDWGNRHNLKEDIIFCGNVKNVNEYMIAADFLFMPSFYEGLPVTLIEAQTAGLMCFVSDCITEEVKLTELIHFLPINQGTGIWVKRVKQFLNYTRENKANMIINQHYDISDLRRELEGVYEG